MMTFITSLSCFLKLTTRLFCLWNGLNVAISQNEAAPSDSGVSCALKDCVYSEWTLWSRCSLECGEDGIRKRTRRMLSGAECADICTDSLEETEGCNVGRCCPRNCEYSDWSPWIYCKCVEGQCNEVGKRYVCLRTRDKVVTERCGGYCDNFIVEERCGNPCCYRDCVLGAWAKWTECQAPCEKPGTKYRNRIVVQEPKCGGRRCPVDTERRQCTGPCCPVDCEQGQWSDWSACSATCGKGLVTRTRFVQEAECGGVACEDNSREETECEQYNNVDCQVAEWALWSECNLLNGKCGNGTRTRSREILVAAECQGKACPELLEEGACTGPCCVIDCQVSDWSEFGHCFTACGEGKRNSTRQIEVKASCGGIGCPEDLVRFEPCTVGEGTDCLFDLWTQWSPCSNRCGRGQETRTRTLRTPAYCGGACPSMATEESRECESYDAKADCQVGDWEAWSECVRDCEGGATTRKRVVMSSDACGGVPCSTYNLTETTSCHARCSQLCDQGQCSCRPGFVLQSDQVTCPRRSCGTPAALQYCGPGTEMFKSCLRANFRCNEGEEFEDQCFAVCPRGWVLKGEERSYTVCTETGNWDYPTVFCGKPNKAPLDITVSSQDISELLKADQCFAKLTTLTDGESWDKHVYQIVKDESSNIKVKDNQLCCIKDFDFETFGLSSWKTTVRSTDLDGLTVEKQFSFTLLNENDPPKSVSLTPNTVPENSPAGTVIGCLQGQDDDPGQVLSFFIVKSIDKLFELFNDERNNTCIRVSKESDPRCYKEGGSWCLLNHEERSSYFIAVMVRDDGQPPLSSYFDLQISVSDVNEPITAVTTKPADIPESVAPGQPLTELMAEDEDKGQGHVFRVVDDVTGFFSTDGDYLVASQTFDYEQDPSLRFVITVEVLDDGTPPMKMQEVLSFSVADSNESPYNLKVTGADKSDIKQLELRENVVGAVLGTVSVYDPDAGDSITLTLSNPKFTLRNKRCSPLKGDVYNYCSAQLVNVAGVDFETNPNITLTVIATDDNFHHIEEDVFVEILDQNDPPTDIVVDGGEDDDVIQVMENHQGWLVARLKVLDEDEQDAHTIFLSGSASSQFTTRQGELFTSPASSLDYETSVPLSLVVTAVDGGRPGLTAVKTFTINVTDVNERPIEITLSNNKVVENSPAGTVVATLSTLDPDNVRTPHQTFTYRLISTAKGRFRLDGHQLVVSELGGGCHGTHCSLNHEEVPELSLEIQSTDDGWPSLSVVKTLTLVVTDVNDRPANVRLSKSTVRENKPPNTLVGTVLADDEDAQDVLTFTLLNGSDAFSIQNKDWLVTRRELDYESSKSFVLAVKVTDSGQPPNTVESTITVVVEDTAEPPVFKSPSVMWTVENELVGTFVGAVVVTDPDLNDAVDLSLHDPSGDWFFLRETQCVTDESGLTCNASLMTSVVLEFEAQNTYELEVVASDGQGHSVVQIVTVNVQDTNDPPSDVLVDGVSTEELRVKEGTVGVQWTLEVVEQDSEQQHVISVSRQEGSHLVVEGNNTLKVTSPFDHETGELSVVVLTVTDNGQPPRSLDKMLQVLVEDVNEAPTQLTITNNKFAENSPGGTVIGQFRGLDPDVGQTLTYSLVEDAGRRFFVEDDFLKVKDHGQCGGSTQPPCPLNFEVEATHMVTVMVTDDGSPRRHATFDIDIEVTDVNDPPRDILLNGRDVEELAPAGTIVGQLTVVDEDRGEGQEERMTFAMLPNDGGPGTPQLFRVDEDSGTVTKATEERLDVLNVYSIKVKVIDLGIPPAQVEKTFYLSISGVSEAPQVPVLAAEDPALLTEPGTLQVPENLAVNAAVATVTSVDMDPDSSLTFTLAEDGAGRFALGTSVNCEVEEEATSCDVDLVLNSPLDYEDLRSFQLLVRVRDPDNMQAALPVSVVVTDVNEPPEAVVFVTGDVILAEENAGGLTLGSFSAVDPDDGDSHIYAITGGDNNHFTVTTTGLLATVQGPGLDYEQQQDHAISLLVTDSAGNSLTRRFNITVVDLNEGPSGLTLEPNRVSEMSPPDTVIGRLIVQDPDNQGVDGVVQNFTFHMLSDHGERFRLDGDTLRVKDMGEACSETGGAACLLDYETKPAHDVILTVTDSGVPPITETMVVRVHVRDANDRPTPPTLDARTISEAPESVGEAVGRLSSSDQDAGQEALRFEVVGEGADVFSVEGDRLVLTSRVDHEERGEVEVTVRVTDDGSPPLSSEETFKITVEDVNEAPSEITIVATQGGAGVEFDTDQPVIAEDTKRGYTVAQLIILDPDLNDEITALLSSSVVRVGRMSCLTLTKGSRCVDDVILGQELNYEDQMTWTVDVTAVDSSGLKLQKTFTVTVEDKNDPPQELLINGKTISNISVPENSHDVTLATLGALDPDENQKHGFTVQSTTLFLTAGDKLQVASAASLDYEETKEYRVTIQITDTGTPPLSLEQEVVVQVTDVNEPPSDVKLSIQQLSEDSQAGRVVGHFLPTDPDNAVGPRQTHSYALTDDAEGRFAVDGEKLVVREARFDYESASSHVIKVQVTDSGVPPLSFHSALTIEVLDANDPPFNLRLNATSLAENSPVGQVVGHLTADDVDNDQVLHYSLEPRHPLFVVSGNEILVDGHLDFESSPTATLTVRVTDTGAPPKSVSKIFTVQIADVNEPPSSVNLTSLMPLGALEIPENTKVDDVICILTTFDPDAVDIVNITLRQTSDPRLKLGEEGTVCEQVTQDGVLRTKCSVHVQLAKELNYEEDKGRVKLKVNAKDKEGLRRKEVWTFKVKDSNDKPTAIFIEGSVTEIPENEASTVLGKLQCLDTDIGDSHTFQLLTGWDLFHVAAGGVLTTVKPLNFERQRSQEVMVRCQDSGQPPLFVTETLRFAVKNVNERPRNITLSHAEVAMTAAKDSIVGFLDVSDPDNEGFVDAKQTHSCQLGQGQDTFYLDSDRNTLRVKDTVPATSSSVSVTITCSDDGTPALSVTQQIQVLVVETPDVPKEIRLVDAQPVTENDPPQLVGRLGVFNMLTGAAVTGDYTCSNLQVEETEEPVLAIDGTGLVTKQPLDFETNPFLTVTLTCAGRDLNANEVNVMGHLKVSVADTNEPPTEVRAYGGAAVEENSPSGTFVTRLDTVDPESYQNHTYVIMSVAAGLNPGASDPDLLDLFTVSGRSLEVGSLAGRLNHEATPVFSLIVQSTDDGSPPMSVEATVMVEVKDVNEPPLGVALQGEPVAENSPVDTLVGRLTVKDEDRGQQHRCQVLNPKDVPFTVKNKLDLVVSREDIDYEATTVYIVEVNCQDEGDGDSHLRVTASLTVNVTDVNEAPYDVRLSKSRLAENSPAGQVVGEILVTDPDSEKVTFTLEEGGGGQFRIVGDNTLTAVSSVDHETTASVPVTVRATDNQGLYSVHTFNVQVEDVNETPTSLTLSHDVVSEGTPSGGEVARLVATDPDRGQTFSFLLTPDPAVDGHFVVSGDKLLVGERGVDYESSSSFRIKVTAVDSGAPPLNTTKEFSVTVTDANEAPTDIVTETIAPVPENVTLPHVVTSLDVIDQDADLRHTCRLLGSLGPLSVDTAQDGAMTLVVQGRLDFETAGRHDVIVSCSDGMYDVSKNLTVEILDVNEPPTLLTLSGPKAIPATVKDEYEVGKITVTDQDRGQTHTLVLEGPNSDLLTIRSGNTLVLTRSVPLTLLSAQPTPAVSFAITATDNGLPPLSMRQSFSLPVTDVDVSQLELPQIALSASRVDEDDAAGTEIGFVYDVNATTGSVASSVEFVVVQDDDNLFQIKDNRVLVLSRDVSSFGGHSAEVTLQARNKHTGETARRTITVLVTRSDKCYQDGRTCDENARCVALNDTSSECRCGDDFKGDGYTCEQINDCVQSDGSSSPCLHGKCVDGVQTFSCSCQPGFVGPLCKVENKTDPCLLQNPCRNGALCRPDVTNSSAVCECKAGWEGTRCEVSVDDCLTGRCHGNSSTCLDQHLTYVCDCGDGRTGLRCEYLTEACPEDACQKTEVCTPVPDSSNHTCETADNTASFYVHCHDFGIMNLLVCEVRFLDFVRTYGRFPESSLTLATRKRKCRSTGGTSGSGTHRAVHVYRVSSEPSPDGSAVNVTLLAQDVNLVAFSRQEVTTALHDMCQSIEADELLAETFCPAIESAYSSHAGPTTDLPEDRSPGGGPGGGGERGGDEEDGVGGGIPVGIIGGAAGGLLVVIIIIVVVVVMRKRKSKPETATRDSQNQSPSGQPKERHGNVELSTTSTSSTLTS